MCCPATYVTHRTLAFSANNGHPGAASSFEQERGKDDETGEELVRRDDDKPEVNHV